MRQARVQRLPPCPGHLFFSFIRRRAGWKPCFFSRWEPTMVRHAIAGSVVVLLVLAGSGLAADKEVKGKIVKVDAKKNVITDMNEDDKKEFDVNKDTKFIGPKGGISDKGIEDDRLEVGAEVTLKVAGNNRTLHEVHLPERKGKDKP